MVFFVALPERGPTSFRFIEDAVATSTGAGRTGWCHMAGIALVGVLLCVSARVSLPGVRGFFRAGAIGIVLGCVSEIVDLTLTRFFTPVPVVSALFDPLFYLGVLAFVIGIFRASRMTGRIRRRGEALLDDLDAVAARRGGREPAGTDRRAVHRYAAARAARGRRGSRHRDLVAAERRGARAPRRHRRPPHPPTHGSPPMIRPLALGAGVVVATVALAHTALAGYVARRLIAPRAAKVYGPVTIAGDTVTVPATLESREPGTYGLWLDDGRHVVIGEPLRVEKDRVVRELASRPDGLADGVAVATWTSQSIGSPEDVGPTRHVSVPLRRGGVAEAWEIGEPDTADGRWTIHVHGLRSSRNGALRSAPAAVDAGWMALVVSYAGDEECAPPMPCPPRWARASGATSTTRSPTPSRAGAREIVLVAWSMGGTIAMLALEHSAHREAIVGLALVAPRSLDWPRVVDNAVANAHLPRTVAAASMRVLGSRLGARALASSRRSTREP